MIKKSTIWASVTALILAIIITIFLLNAIADDVVPTLPAIPVAADPAPPKNNWLWEYYNDGYHKPKKEMPVPLTAKVTAENPLKVDVYFSIRSPYSYLVLQRILWLHSNYNIDITIKTIFPVAVRARGKAGKVKGGRWYKLADAVHDTKRVGQYQGVPFKWANPDPIEQDIYPVGEASGAITALEKQPYIGWMIRLANASQLAGVSLEFSKHINTLIWGGQSDNWPRDVEKAFNKIGINYQETIKDIKANPEKYDAVWKKNQDEQRMTGHGGVPNMVFRGEPFFGQDRFDLLFWRLLQNGLTKREKSIAPFVKKPLRWPEFLEQ